MKIELSSKFVKAGVDIKNGDNIIIRTEGKKEKNKWGNEAYNFAVELPNGDTKQMRFNQSSLRWLCEKYGDETANWIDKEIPVMIITQNVQGKFVKVAYIGDLPEGFEPEK